MNAPSESSRNAENRARQWTWPGPAEIYPLLPFLAAGFIVPHYFGKSEFAMALFTGLVLCACLPYQALRRTPDKWTRSITWVMRVTAIVTAAWLFIAAPTRAGRLVAVILFAGLYGVCEWMVWRRMRVEQSANHDLAT